MAARMLSLWLCPNRWQLKQHCRQVAPTPFRLRVSQSRHGGEWGGGDSRIDGASAHAGSFATPARRQKRLVCWRGFKGNWARFNSRKG